MSETPEGRPLLAGLLTRKQVAAELEVTERTIARWDAEGIGPPRVSYGKGKRIRYRRADVLKWLESR